MMIQIGDWTGVISDVGSELQRIVLDYALLPLGGFLLR